MFEELNNIPWIYPGIQGSGYNTGLDISSQMGQLSGPMSVNTGKNLDWMKLMKLGGMMGQGAQQAQMPRAAMPQAPSGHAGLLPTNLGGTTIPRDLALMIQASLLRQKLLGG